MLAKFWRFLFRASIVLIVGLLLVFGLPNLIASSFAVPRIHTVQTVPAARVAIVFGAGLTRDGSPSAVLRDRVEAASELYHSGKVNKLLMSGDNRFATYNEPGAMREYALGLGIPDEDIVLDFAGRRTYDTCYRAQYIFGVQEAILVTQQFHLARALITCNNLGVESLGVAADRRTFRRSLRAYWQIREMAATSVALWEVWVSRPLPVLGQPEPIFTEENARMP